MEAEVNIHYDELLGNKSASRDQLLTNQLQRLLMCFDVYVETESENAAMEGPVEFAKERIFTKNTRFVLWCSFLFDVIFWLKFLLINYYWLLL